MKHAQTFHGYWEYGTVLHVIVSTEARPASYLKRDYGVLEQKGRSVIVSYFEAA